MTKIEDKKIKDPVLKAFLEMGCNKKQLEVLRANSFTEQGLQNKYGLLPRGIEGVISYVKNPNHKESVREFVDALYMNAIFIAMDKSKMNAIRRENQQDSKMYGAFDMPIGRGIADFAQASSSMSAIQKRQKEIVEEFIERMMDIHFKTKGEKIVANQKCVEETQGNKPVLAIPDRVRFDG